MAIYDAIMFVGQTMRLHVASVLANDTQAPPPQPITWSVDEPTIVSLIDVSSDSASITAIALTDGVATLTIVAGVYTKTFSIDVKLAPDDSVVDAQISF